MFSVTLKPALNMVSDLKKLDQKTQKGIERVLKRSGAKVRGIMRRLIKRRKKPSISPNPPHAHTTGNEFGLKTIVYKFYKDRMVVETGPLLKNSTDVPGNLEKGGIVPVKLRDGSIRMVKMGKRVFAQTAIETYARQYPEEYRDMLKYG